MRQIIVYGYKHIDNLIYTKGTFEYTSDAFTFASKYPRHIIYELTDSNYVCLKKHGYPNNTI